MMTWSCLFVAGVTTVGIGLAASLVSQPMTIQVADIHRVSKHQKVFNLSVDANQNYYVSQHQILVHNCKPIPPELTGGHRPGSPEWWDWVKKQDLPPQDHIQKFRSFRDGSRVSETAWDIVNQIDPLLQGGQPVRITGNVRFGRITLGDDVLSARRFHITVNPANPGTIVIELPSGLDPINEQAFKVLRRELLKFGGKVEMVSPPIPSALDLPQFELLSPLGSGTLPNAATPKPAGPKIWLID